MGKDIIVRGCTSIGFERDAVFLSELDRKFAILENAIRLSFKKENYGKFRSLDGQVCHITGTFKAADSGKLFYIEVKDISYLPIPSIPRPEK